MTKKNGEEVETGLKLAVFFCNVELLGTKLILLWIISENRFSQNPTPANISF